MIIVAQRTRKRKTLYPGIKKDLRKIPLAIGKAVVYNTIDFCPFRV